MFRPPLPVPVSPQVRTKPAHVFDPATIPFANIVGGGQTSLTQIDLPIGGLYRLSNGNATDRTAMGRAVVGLGGINAWRSNGPGRRVSLP